jgi:diadenylate cyclase
VGGRLAQLYESLGTSDLVQIAILAVVIYAVIHILGKTGGSGTSIGRGLGLVVVGIFLIVQVIIASLDMTELATVLDYLLTTVLLGMLVIFQPELRRGLMMLGRSKLWRYFTPSSHSLAERLADAATLLARDRIGALVAIQAEMSLAPFIETGERLDAHVSSALVRTVFYPRGPLHDGALILVNGRIAAAACQLPLGSVSSATHLGGGLHLGMRHRAALGLSEETDAIVLVVSEESGRISLAVGGRLEAVSGENLARRLASLFKAPHALTLRKTG